jgi:hypothetical protein
MNRTHIRHLTSSAALLALVLMGLGKAHAQVVISHPSVTLAAADIRDVFLGDKQLAGSTKLVPVDNSATQDGFLSKFVHLDPSKYASLWTKKSFREGISAPTVKGSDAVLDFVKRTPGAVGYVKAAGPGVNVVAQ